jgi:hypothetical protein
VDKESVCDDVGLVDALRGEMGGYLCTLVNRRERGLDISFGKGEGELVVATKASLE